MFNFISNQRKQPKDINESFINQINEVYILIKETLKLLRMGQDGLSHAADKS